MIPTKNKDFRELQQPIVMDFWQILSNTEAAQVLADAVLAEAQRRGFSELAATGHHIQYIARGVMGMLESGLPTASILRNLTAIPSPKFKWGQ